MTKRNIHDGGPSNEALMRGSPGCSLNHAEPL